MLIYDSKYTICIIAASRYPEVKMSSLHSSCYILYLISFNIPMLGINLRVLTWVGRIFVFYFDIMLTHVKTHNTLWLPWIFSIIIFLTVQITVAHFQERW